MLTPHSVKMHMLPSIESHLQPFTGECVQYRIIIVAGGGGLIILFFTSPYDQHTLKRRHYDQRVREIEHRTFTPLASPVYNREHGKSGGHLL